MSKLCICLPEKCYRDSCEWCNENDVCVKGDEVVFGIALPGEYWVLVAAFSPFVVGLVGMLVYTLVTR